MLNSDRVRWTWFALGCLLLVAACSPERDENSLFVPADIDVPVVDGLLVVGKSLPEIRLSRTRPPDELYDFAEAAIREADVRVITAAGDTARYAERDTTPGIYWPDLDNVVTPESVYELIVETRRGERITATTTTPPQLVVDAWLRLSSQADEVIAEMQRFEEVGDGVFEAPENQVLYTVGILEARLSSEPPVGYQLSVASLDLGSDFVIDVPFLDDEDLAEIERSGSSPPVEVEDDAVQLPWFSIYFEGRHVWKIHALDRNAYDLIRTSPEEGDGFGFGGNPGDDFDRPIYWIDGGVGLFGSSSVDSLGFYISPAP
ncbi:DUF4249 family protein [bacterium]|nr:DUF4249 family protein [bacterium]